MRIAVIGLGLMGASLAQALKGFREARVFGADISESVCTKAVASGVVEEAWTDPSLAIDGADLTIFSVYASQVPAILQKTRAAFKPGSVVSDICGVKNKLYEAIKDLIPESVEYIGLHPMAGKERDGFENADPAIYKNCGMIVCPESGVKPETVEMMLDLSGYVGAARLAVVSPERQDEIIAYTSSLMHIASAGLCLDYHPALTPAFTAGAFRDCTRVADINAPAWAELLMDNRVHTLKWLGKYIDNLEKFRQSLEVEDQSTLQHLLAEAGDKKREILTL